MADNNNLNPETNGRPILSISNPSTPRSTRAPNTPNQFARMKPKAPLSPLIGRSPRMTPNSPSINRITKSAQNSPVLKHKVIDGQTTPITSIDIIKTSTTAPPSPSLSINRNAYNLPEFNKTYLPIETQKTTTEKMRKLKPDLSKKAWIRRLKSFFPIFIWLPQYNLKQNLIVDIIVGITIASFQVPQSMGYSLIAHVNPVFGLYTAFFPALLYTILGTSKHCAVGPVAIVAGLMTGNIVIAVMEDLGMNYQEKRGIGGIYNTSNTGIPEGFEDITNIDIAIMVGLINGVYVFTFGCLRLGFISNYLSEELVSGFMTSAAIYVFTTQLHYLVGVNLENRSGPLALIKTYIEFFERIKEVNLTALTISLICVAVLLFYILVVQKQLLKFKITMPFPIHLFIMIGGTVASNLMNLENEYNVQVVGNIPSTFANPSLPKFKLFKYLWYRCIPTAVVAYTITLSVGKLYATKHNYKVDPNQEMIALGACNLWGSIFSCIPSSASIPRSSVQESGGGKTQIVSVVNCLCIVVVILALSTLLHDLPNCVLAACIAVALVSIISKFKEFVHFWKISKIDGAIWIITFLGVMILNIDYGIYIGFGCSLLLLIYKSQRPKTYSLGSVDNSDIYVPLSKFQRAKEIEGVKIYQFCGPLNFANIEYFKKELQVRSGVNVNAIKEKMDSLRPQSSCFIFTSRSSKSYQMEEISLGTKNSYSLPTHIIIDCSMLSYIDTTGVTTLKITVKKHEEINIMCLLTGCQVHVENMLRKDGFFEQVSQDRVYKSVHDAVTYIREGFSPISVPQTNDKSNNSIKQIHSPELLSATLLNQNKNSINNEHNNISNDYTKETGDTLNETQIAFKSALKGKAEPFSNSKKKSSSLDSLSSSSS